MGDLLAAGSLLLTVVTILYSLWYPEITTAASKKVDNMAENRKDAYKECCAILWWKTVPLCVIASVLCLINIPDSYTILCFALAQANTTPRAPYSAINTTFVMVTFLLAFLAAHTIKTTIVLWSKVGKMNPAKGNYG